MSWQLILAERPWSLNDERTKHWAHTSRRTKHWRKAFTRLALEAGMPQPLTGAVQITAMPAFKGHRIQDVGNCMPAVKAAIDGLIDAGVLRNDSPKYVSCLSFVAPAEGQPRDALILWIDYA